jgi:hypothetical protein
MEEAFRNEAKKRYNGVRLDLKIARGTTKQSETIDEAQTTDGS